jgi:hypothetical protein
MLYLQLEDIMDIIVQYWPIIVAVIGLVLWLGRLQFTQTSIMKDLRSLVSITEKLTKHDIDIAVIQKEISYLKEQMKIA